MIGRRDAIPRRRCNDMSIVVIIPKPCKVGAQATVIVSRFNEWWPLHDIYDDSGVYKQFNHPVAGTLDFESSCFDVPANSGFRLFIHVPLSGTDTSSKMRRLLG